MFGLLKAVASVGGGFAAIGAGLLYSFYKGFFSSELLKGLPPESIYKLFLYCLATAVFCFLLLIVLQIMSKGSSISTKASGKSVAVTSTGSGAVNVYKEKE
jgi:hypothetical protein